MKIINLTQNKVALVDDEDFEFLNKFKWHYGNGGYAKRTDNKNNRKIHMHRLIMNTPVGMHTDHRDGNKLNNQKHNLRICSNSENMRNRKTQKHSSKFKGVFWHKKNNKWLVQITFNQKSIHLGYFNDEQEAAIAYNEKALELFEEFAKLNEVI